MRQAIVTRYHGPTNYRGARVSAKADAGNVSLSWDDTLDVDGNHEKVAKALANRFGWLDHGWQLVAGGLPDNKGNVYVLAKGEKVST